MAVRFNPLAAVRAFLLEDPDVQLMVGDYVFAERLPRRFKDQIDDPHVILRSRPGPLTIDEGSNSYLPVASIEMDTRCYHKDILETQTLVWTIDSLLLQIRRWTGYPETAIESVTVSARPYTDFEPPGDWAVSIAAYYIHALKLAV